MPLPAKNDRLAGQSTDTKQNYSLSVSNADGYLCHLTATCYFHGTPETVYAIFVNPGAVHVCNLILLPVRRCSVTVCALVGSHLQCACCCRQHWCLQRYKDQRSQGGSGRKACWRRLQVCLAALMFYSHVQSYTCTTATYLVFVCTGGLWR